MARILGHSMKTYELTHERKVRVWLNETAKHKDENTSEPLLVKGVSCNGGKRPLREAVCIELLVPLGGRFLYGMLGGIGTGGSAHEATLQISNSLIAEESEGAVDPLSGRLDQVSPWVSIDYCSSILDGAGLAAKNYASFFPSFTFNMGRQGVIGSSPNFFRLLGFLVVSMLAVPDRDVEEYLNSISLDIGIE